MHFLSKETMTGEKSIIFLKAVVRFCHIYPVYITEKEMDRLFTSRYFCKHCNRSRCLIEKRRHFVFPKRFLCFRVGLRFGLDLSEIRFLSKCPFRHVY